MSFSSNIKNIFEWISNEIADEVFGDSDISYQNNISSSSSYFRFQPNYSSSKLSPVCISAFSSWNDVSAFPPIHSNVIKQNNEIQTTNLPFNIEDSINQKIYLYDGNIAQLMVDVIVCFTNENIEFNEEAQNNILEGAGPDLLEAMRSNDISRSGDAHMTRGFNLHAKKIVHAVGPRYNPKYDTASHNTLHGCYREALKCMVEANLRTIALPCIFSRKRNFELEACAHTVLRTVRRWMEHIDDKVDAVVFCSNKIDELDIFQNLMKIYFPRNYDEMKYSENYKISNVGNAYGELEVEDRRIRIGMIGGGPSSDTSNNVASSTKKLNETKRNEIIHGVDVSFTETKPLSESERRLKIKSNIISGDFSQEGELVYNAHLRDALNMLNTPVFKALQENRFIYHAGEDYLKRNIIVFCAALLPSTRYEWNILLLYIIKTLDPYIRDKYVIVYVNAEVSVFANNPGISLFKEIFSLYQDKYENMLDQLYVLFPGTLFKTAFLCCWPFMSNHVWNGTKYINSIKELEKYCNTKELMLPKYVYDYALQADGFR